VLMRYLLVAQGGNSPSSLQRAEEFIDRSGGAAGALLAPRQKNDGRTSLGSAVLSLVLFVRRDHGHPPVNLMTSPVTKSAAPPPWRPGRPASPSAPRPRAAGRRDHSPPRGGTWPGRRRC